MTLSYVPIPEGQEIFATIQNRLGDGWFPALISNATPGIVRIQLCADGPEDRGWRTCVEAPTLAQAIDAADEFTHRVTVEEYERDYWAAVDEEAHR